MLAIFGKAAQNHPIETHHAKGRLPTQRAVFEGNLTKEK